MTTLTQQVIDAAPKTPTADKLVDVDVVARRCVYVNDFRIAGGKPYYSEKLPSHTLKTTLGDVLKAFTNEEIRKALDEQEARAKYLRDAWEAASAIERSDHHSGETNNG